MAQDDPTDAPQPQAALDLPQATRHYLAHVAAGQPIRQLAREAQLHASTVSRQVRRLEAQRDDPLLDEALRHAGSIPPRAALTGDALRILRRLSESGTELVVGQGMETVVVLRAGADGAPQRIAVAPRAVAAELALREHIATRDAQARVARYAITATGRAALRQAAPALRSTDPAEEEDPRRLRHMRSLMGESPITALARRQSKTGAPFLARELVVAAERLREDYELSRDTEDGGEGARAAGARLQAALATLGPGLADVALRCCCYLEGLESVETRMDWSARSGKVVLRIALARLDLHYTQTGGRFAPLIGQGARPDA